MMKMAMSIPVQNFLHDQNWGKIPFVHTSTDSSVHHTDSPSIISSPSTANLSKIPCNYGEKNMVNSLHKNPVKSPTISTSCVTSVVAPIHASSIQPVCTSCVMSVHASSMQPICTLFIMSIFPPIHASHVLSVHPYDNERQEFPDGFPGTKYGEKNPSLNTVKFPHDVTPTLKQEKFPEDTPDTTMKVKYTGNFMLTRIQFKFMVISLRNYVLGVFQVTSHTMRCAHGFINKILLEWHPGPTYDVQRLWDPGGSNYSSGSSVPTNLDKVGKLESYLDYIHLPGLSSLPFLVAVKPNLAPSNHLGKLDHMGSFMYLPRQDQQV